MTNLITVELDDVVDCESLDSPELVRFLSHNERPFCFMRLTNRGRYFLYFVTKSGHQFGLACQKRNDRIGGIRMFDKTDTAINYAVKHGFERVIFFKENEIVKIAGGFLLMD